MFGAAVNWIVADPVPDVGVRVVSQFGTGLSTRQGQPGPAFNVKAEVFDDVRMISCVLSVKEQLAAGCEMENV